MDDVVDRWIAAGQAGDAAAAAACLAPDAEFVSPLTDRFSFRGADQVRTLLDAVFSVVEGFHHLDRVGGTGFVALRARGRLGRVRLEEAQLLSVEDGLLREVRLFVRPVPAATALMQALGPLLASGPSSVVLGVATRGLHTLASSGDRALVPLARPR